MDRERSAASIVLAALLLGIAGDVLLRHIPWGINVLMWMALLTGVALAVGNAHKLAAVACLLAAAGIAWRDSPVLVLLDVALLVLFLPMLALGTRGVRAAAAGLAEIALAVVTTGAQSIAGFPQLVFRDVSWKHVPRFRGFGVAARGTLFAAPALIIFGSLLTSADPAFERVLGNFITFDVGELALHLLVTAIVTAACAGFLRSLVLSGPMPSLDGEKVLSLPAAETNFALALLNILFALFVAVQFRYLFFGGSALSASEYARRGFFELVWVVALVLPMLLLLEWLVNDKRLFRWMAGIQVSLVFVIAASAYRRMQLYRDEFGLTRLRLFTTAFMIWIAVLLLWFVVTVLTGRRRRFAIGVLTTAVAMVVVLHAVNPDALIAETNIARARAGRRALDGNYLMSLSDDAMPAIAANADAFDPIVLYRYTLKPRPIGWRTWNLSRARAYAAMRGYESKATPPMARPPVRDAGSMRESRSSRRLVISRNR